MFKQKNKVSTEQVMNMEKTCFTHFIQCKLVMNDEKNSLKCIVNGKKMYVPIDN